MRCGFGATREKIIRYDEFYDQEIESMCNVLEEGSRLNSLWNEWKLVIVYLYRFNFQFHCYGSTTLLLALRKTRLYVSVAVLRHLHCVWLGWAPGKNNKKLRGRGKGWQPLQSDSQRMECGRPAVVVGHEKHRLANHLIESLAVLLSRWNGLARGNLS